MTQWSAFFRRPDIARTAAAVGNGARSNTMEGEHSSTALRRERQRGRTVAPGPSIDGPPLPQATGSTALEPLKECGNRTTARSKTYTEDRSRIQQLIQCKRAGVSHRWKILRHLHLAGAVSRSDRAQAGIKFGHICLKLSKSTAVEFYAFK